MGILFLVKVCNFFQFKLVGLLYKWVIYDENCYFTAQTVTSIDNIKIKFFM